MGLFDKLFGRRASPGAEQARAIIRKAWEDFKNRKELTKRRRPAPKFVTDFTVVEEVEAKLGGLAIGIASAEGVLMVHPKLEEELRKQPDADFLKLRLHIAS